MIHIFVQGVYKGYPHYPRHFPGSLPPCAGDMGIIQDPGLLNQYRSKKSV